MIVLPLRSRTRVHGAVCAAMAASVPTAKIRSPAIATPWAIVNWGSTVMTLAFLRTKSAGRVIDEVDVCAAAGELTPNVKAEPAAPFRSSRREMPSCVICRSAPCPHSLTLAKRCYRYLPDIVKQPLWVQPSSVGANVSALPPGDCLLRMNDLGGPSGATNSLTTSGPP